MEQQKNVHPREAVLNLIRYSGISPRIIWKPVSQAIGHVLAENAFAEADVPPNDLSMMDGYAVRASDVKKVEKGEISCLKIVEGVDPRRAYSYSLGAGETVYVDTGFPLPKGSDAVIPVEKAYLEEKCVRTDMDVYSGMNVNPRGSLYKRGDVVASSGEVIGGLHIRAFLDAGVRMVRVYEPPRIKLLPIGDELLEPWEEKKKDTQVYEGTRYILKDMLALKPATINSGTVIPDDPESIINEIEKALKIDRPDILVLISGSSMGRKDYSWRMPGELRPKYFFRGLRAKPGRTTTGYSLRGKILIIIPGVVQASIAASILLLNPLVEYFNGGLPIPRFNCYETYIEETYHVPEGNLSIYNIRWVKRGRNGVKITEHLPRNMIKDIIATEGFIAIPPGKKVLEEGEKVAVYRLSPCTPLCSLPGWTA